jgi:hypothetical protein
MHERTGPGLRVAYNIRVADVLSPAASLRSRRGWVLRAILSHHSTCRDPRHPVLASFAGHSAVYTLLQEVDYDSVAYGG